MRSLYGVWPLTASMEVKNKYAHVITQDICNKFIEVNFYVGCKVSPPNRLLQDSTTMSLINKIGTQYYFNLLVKSYDYSVFYQTCNIINFINILILSCTYWT